MGCYDIAYPAGDAAAESAAGELSSWIAENVGYVMPVCGEGQGENLLNLCLSPQENRQDAETCTLSLGSGGGVIEYAAGETEHAVQSFIAHFFRSEETDVVLPGEGTFGFMVWEYLDSDYETDEIVVSPQEIAEGVSWSNFTMTDADGRQSGYSVGMNLVDLAQVFKSLGAVSALNLDGGGSSTFVTKNSDGSLSVKNKTSNSGGALRAVGDCLILTAA